MGSECNSNWSSRTPQHTLTLKPATDPNPSNPIPRTLHGHKLVVEASRPMTGFTLLVSGLPSAHWRDLKAFGQGPQRAFRPTHAGFHLERRLGTIEYADEEEMQAAQRALDGQLLYNRVVRVEVVGGLALASVGG